MAQTTQEPQTIPSSEKTQTSTSTLASPVEGGGAGEEVEESTETAKAGVVASDEGDHIKLPSPSGEGEVFVGSVSKVATESGETTPPPVYNAQCALCAQSYEGEDQQEITDSLNAHYTAAHIYYDGSGIGVSVPVTQ